GDRRAWTPDLVSVSKEAWQTAVKRFKTLKPLLELDGTGRTLAKVSAVATALGRHPSTIYRWMEEYERTERLSVFLRLGGHVKTDHRGSLQNRPMGTTLDKNLFYRARYGGGNPSSDLIGPRIGMFSLRDPSAESGSNPRLPAREGARGRSG